MAGPSAPPETGPRLSLVLGSGGARGYAHIGVIEELVAQGYEIASIAGSSIGALVGGIYAAGKLEDYRDWVVPLERMDVFRLLDWTLSGGGFIKGNRIMDALRELVGETNIEDLPVPYTAVAVDLEAQREVWFSSGLLFEAIRASIAIPTIFRPYLYQGRLLVDGGLLNPLPVSPTLRDRTDYTLAVDLNGEPEPGLYAHREPLVEQHERGIQHGLINHLLPHSSEPDDACKSDTGYIERLKHLAAGLSGHASGASTDAPEPSMFDLFARSLDTVQATVTRLKLAAQPPDLRIGIPRNACAFYEFHRAADLIEIGRQRTREALERWQPRPRKHPHI